MKNPKFDSVWKCCIGGDLESLEYISKVDADSCLGDVVKKNIREFLASFQEKYSLIGQFGKKSID